MTFGGLTYDKERDHGRLKNQLRRVKEFVLGKFPEFVTLHRIALEIEAPWESIPAISARLRDLRKPEFGGYMVESRNMGGGKWAYRVHPKSDE